MVPRIASSKHKIQIFKKSWVFFKSTDGNNVLITLRQTLNKTDQKCFPWRLNGIPLFPAKTLKAKEGTKKNPLDMLEIFIYIIYQSFDIPDILVNFNFCIG